MQTYRTAIEIAPGDYWEIKAGVTVLSETGIGAHAAYTRTFTNFFTYDNLTAWQDFALALDGRGMAAVSHGTMSGRGGVSITNGATFFNVGQIIVWPSPGDTMRPGIKVAGDGDSARIVNSGEVGGEVSLLSRGAAVELANSGVLHGAVSLGDGKDTVGNVGEILGEVRLGGGDDRYDGRGGAALSVDGEGGVDIILGGDGSDVLNGGRGRDVVRSGDGDDTIVFADLKAPDRIEDFVVGEDRIHLDNAALKGLGGDGALTANAFHTGATATDDGHRIIYDAETGRL